MASPLPRIDPHTSSTCGILIFKVHSLNRLDLQLAKMVLEYTAYHTLIHYQLRFIISSFTYYNEITTSPLPFPSISSVHFLAKLVKSTLYKTPDTLLFTFFGVKK